MRENTILDKSSDIPDDSDILSMSRGELLAEVHQLRKQVVRLAQEVVKSEMSAWQVQTQREQMEFRIRESGAYTEMLRSQTRDMQQQITAMDQLKAEASRLSRSLEDCQIRLDIVLRLCSLASWELDFNTDKLLRSPELMAMLGIEGKAEVPAADPVVSLLVHPEDAKIFDSSVRHVISENEPVNFTCRIVRKNGEVRRIAFIVDYLPGERGKVFGLAQDVTP